MPRIKKIQPHVILYDFDQIDLSSNGVFITLYDTKYPGGNVYVLDEKLLPSNLRKKYDKVARYNPLIYLRFDRSIAKTAELLAGAMLYNDKLFKGLSKVFNAIIKEKKEQEK